MEENYSTCQSMKKKKYQASHSVTYLGMISTKDGVSSLKFQIIEWRMLVWLICIYKAGEHQCHHCRHIYWCLGSRWSWTSGKPFMQTRNGHISTETICQCGNVCSSVWWSCNGTLVHAVQTPRHQEPISAEEGARHGLWRSNGLWPLLYFTHLALRKGW